MSINIYEKYIKLFENKVNPYLKFYLNFLKFALCEFYRSYTLNILCILWIFIFSINVRNLDHPIIFLTPQQCVIVIKNVINVLFKKYKYQKEKISKRKCHKKSEKQI